jgi:uncharacterized membrane protein YbaN (DUF454 family)
LPLVGRPRSLGCKALGLFAPAPKSAFFAAALLFWARGQPNWQEWVDEVDEVYSRFAALIFG